MVNIEDYKKPNGSIDYDRFNADLKNLKQQNYDRALSTFAKAQELARLNGARLLKCSTWHFKLKVCQSIYHLYPSNQRIYIEPNNKGVFLNVPHPWTFLDVVARALFINVLKPKQIAEKIL